MNSTLLKQIIIGAIAFIVVGLAIGFGPSMLTGFEATRNDVEALTATYAVTPALSVSANMSTITFARPLIDTDTTHVTSITSNITGQTLTVAAGTLTTTSTNITGHTDLTLQTLTVVYEYGTNQYYTGLSTTLAMGPTLVLLGFIIFVGVVGFMGIKVAGENDAKSS